MINVNCQACGLSIDLDTATYKNFQGPITCPPCKTQQSIVIQDAALQSSFVGTDWVSLVSDLQNIDMPVEILLDAAEAAVLAIGAYKSCAVMCGRSLNGALIDKGVGDEKSFLGTMIEDAAKSGIISSDIYETTKAANYFRITGAHPKQLRSITRTQAYITFEVTKDVLKDMFPTTENPPWKQEGA